MYILWLRGRRWDVSFVISLIRSGIKHTLLNNLLGFSFGLSSQSLVSDRGLLLFWSAGDTRIRRTSNKVWIPAEFCADCHGN